MKNKINSNKGIFLETLINTSSIFLEAKGICLILKRQIPIQIVEKISSYYIKAKLNEKAYTDYYGCYKSKMFDFEAKQTQNKDFMMNLIKKHQLNHIINCERFKIHSFLLIHFVLTNDYFIINSTQLKKFVGKTKIEYKWIKQNCYEMELIFPGILNFEDYLSFIFDRI